MEDDDEEIDIGSAQRETILVQPLLIEGDLEEEKVEED